MKRKGIIGILVLITVAGLLIGCFLIQQPSPEPLPNPNGYDDLVAAGNMISGKAPDGTNASASECRIFVFSNSPALARGRLGLTKECRVPTQYSGTWLQIHTEQIMATRNLAKAFCVEGNLARLEHRSTDAATSYMAAIRIGVAVEHGGLMIDGLVGTACEGQGEMCIASAIHDFDVEQLSLLANDLQRVEAEEEPCVQILQHERRWSAAQLKSVGGIENYIDEAITKRTLMPDRAAQHDFAAQYNGRLTWTLHLQAKLAAQAYALENSRWPTNWSDLVPHYLKAIPDVSFGPDDTNRFKLQESGSTDRWLF